MKSNNRFQHDGSVADVTILTLSIKGNQRCPETDQLFARGTKFVLDLEGTCSLDSTYVTAQVGDFFAAAREYNGSEKIQIRLINVPGIFKSELQVAGVRANLAYQGVETAIASFGKVIADTQNCTVISRQEEGITIIDIWGLISIGEGAAFLRKAVRIACDKCQARSQKCLVILNFAGVTYMDATGVGELTTSFTLCSNAGGNLVLTNPRKAVRAMLDVARLQNVIQIHPSEAEAIAALKSATAPLR